jgi:EKC/KEOPS complex subunit PCC1/LAGE3
MRALGVDKELSPLVRRTFDVIPPDADTSSQTPTCSVLRVQYKATTNRMLRVAVNSFMDSLVFNIEVMASMDQDILETAEPTEA